MRGDMNILQIFKEQDGQYSARRVSIFLFIALFAWLSYYAIETHKDTSSWYVFIPAALCIVAILFFTGAITISGIKEIYQMSKKENQ
jgi:uncharacterized protein with PQ loop repeat